MYSKMIKSKLLAFLIGLILTNAYAQDLSIGATADYNVPFGKLQWLYKPAPGGSIEFMRWNDNGRVSVGKGISVGYHAFQPLADTLYFLIDQGGFGGVSLGKVSFETYRFFKLSVLMDFDIRLGKKVSLVAGVGVAINYVSRDYYYEDAYEETSGSEMVALGGLTPRLKLNFKITDRFSFAPYASYSVLLQAGDPNAHFINFDSGTGTFSHYMTSGLAFNFTF
jgi:hypothetical protein